MDAIELLTKDHRDVEALFKKYEDSDDPMTLAETAEKICTSLRVHMQIEEELFYPKAREILSKDDSDKLVDHAEKEHGMAKTMISKIMTMAMIGACVAAARNAPMPTSANALGLTEKWPSKWHKEKAAGADDASCLKGKPGSKAGRMEALC